MNLKLEGTVLFLNEILETKQIKDIDYSAWLSIMSARDNLKDAIERLKDK